MNQLLRMKAMMVSTVTLCLLLCPISLVSGRCIFAEKMNVKMYGTPTVGPKSGKRVSNKNDCKSLCLLYGCTTATFTDNSNVKLGKTAASRGPNMSRCLMYKEKISAAISSGSTRATMSVLYCKSGQSAGTAARLSKSVPQRVAAFKTVPTKGRCTFSEKMNSKMRGPPTVGPTSGKRVMNKADCKSLCILYRCTTATFYDNSKVGIGKTAASRGTNMSRCLMYRQTVSAAVGSGSSRSTISVLYCKSNQSTFSGDTPRFASNTSQGPRTPGFKSTPKEGLVEYLQHADKAAAKIKGKKPVKINRVAKDSVIFRVQCGNLASVRIDPIVSPGSLSQHVHTFFGPASLGLTIQVNKDFTKNMKTTCNMFEDKSMYWTPTMYQKRPSDNKWYIVPVKSAHYYLDTGLGDLYSMPLGLEMLTGQGKFRWFCISPGYFTSEEWETIPPKYGRDKRKCTRLQARLEFPTCWNGYSLKSADNQSHVKFNIKGRCPVTHPFRIPQVRSVITYNINHESTHEFILANRDTTGEKFHGDFVSGWDESLFPSLLTYCSKNVGPGCKASKLFPTTVQIKNSVPVPTYRSLPTEPVNGVATLPGYKTSGTGDSRN